MSDCIPFRGRKREKKGLASKLKGLRPPGPGEMVDGYFASEFHQKNFKQPLVSRARQEDQVRYNSDKALELHFRFLFTFRKKGTFTFKERFLFGQ